MTYNSGPYPISSNSRAKLDAFRFCVRPERSTGRSPSSASQGLGNNDKENQHSWISDISGPSQPKPGMGNLLSQTKEAEPVKECPQTPANRIPLADLISSTEDVMVQDPAVEVTPSEHVIWQHVPASSNADTKTQTPATSKKRRRYSSTSAVSPSAEDLKEAHKVLFDPQLPQALLKTPQTDIAADLWSNYIERHKADGNGEIQSSRLDSLLASSPRTPISAKASTDSTCLRRSVSCNAEWPTSKTKRTEIGRNNPRPKRSAFARTTSNTLDSRQPKTWRINHLIEQIEKTLQRPLPGPSNLSPAPGDKGRKRSRSSSPTESRANRSFGKSCCQADVESRPCNDKAEVYGFSSEFEDEDLDQDLLDFAAASVDPFVDTKQSHNITESADSEAKASALKGHRQLSQGTKCPDTPLAPPDLEVNIVSQDSINDTDEFEDDCDGDRLEEIAAQYDRLPVPNTPIKATESQRLVSDIEVFGTIREVERPEVAKTLPLGDEFGELDEFDELDDDDFDLEAVEQCMKQSAEVRSNYTPRNQQVIKRYQIADIAEGTYVTISGSSQPELVLRVVDEKTKQQKIIILRGSWYDSPCSKGSYVHLIGDFDITGQCVVDDHLNMIILHPDHLISATAVADSMSCPRRAVLQDRIKAFSELGKPQVFGILLHEIFQDALRANQWDLGHLRMLVDATVIKHIEDLYVTRMSVQEATNYVMGKIPTIKTWAETFIRAKPSAESYVEDRHNSRFNLSITKLLEVEEHVWSPMYGLKGNIDATVQVACWDGQIDKNLVVPLELKTGRKDTDKAHRAQTALYTLLLSDRYDLDITFGLLYYTELSRTLRIRGVRHELLQMIQQRNRLAEYVRDRTRLPPMNKDSRRRNRCYAKTACFIYHKLMEDGNGETSGFGSEFTDAVSHLNDSHRDFFRKWDGLLTKEEQIGMKLRRELWTLSSSERESLGRCFSNVIIEPGSAYENRDDTRINRYRYTFIKRHPPPSFSFTQSQITVGEPVVISDEKGHFALANGYVVKVSPRYIIAAVDRRLHNARSRSPGFNADLNQTFQGIMEVSEGDARKLAASDYEPEETVYRLDKDEFSNGMAIVRNNIISIMEKDLFQAKQLRRLIVEGEAPIFEPLSSTHTTSFLDGKSLNVDQKRAINKVMSAKDYALVLGMPGTGKTTTIAYIIRALVSQGKSVLLTSYTHSAVDNILLKIRNNRFHILRIGAPTKVHPDVQQFADLAAIPKRTVEEVKRSYEESQVVATTCLGVNHRLFNQRVFDYCIVDEASQITLPVCLGPIRMARIFILVGDHYQLPPLVQSKEAQEGGLDVSLFKLLSDYHPSSVVNLEHQYRMCEDIMLLSNSLIYSGRLKCGTQEVASRSLEIPNIGGLEQHHLDHTGSFLGRRQLCLGADQERCWLHDLISPAAKTYLVNTDTTAATPLEVISGMRIVNPTESTLCAQIVESFISCGIPARSIGVITFYRSQLALLKQDLRRHLPDLEMHTADKFQGRDKEIVVLSCVRSNSEKHVGELLHDWRRVNVAFTRARTKLLVVGSKSTLRDGDGLLAKYVDLMESRGWIYNLPRDAAQSHIFDSLDPAQSQPQPQSQDQQSATSLSPRKNPTQPKPARNPLSPLNSSNKLKKPTKRRGVKPSPSNNRILGDRPLLQDIINDLVG